MSDVILLAHATFGVAGCLAALWVFVETLNAKPENAGRIRAASFLTAACRPQIGSLIAGLAAITGLAMEGAGAVIDHGVKVALLQNAR
jgi:hypothetical protein